MIVLPAGEEKFLTFNNEALLRNAERARPGDAAAVVISGGKVFHAFGILADGPLVFRYPDHRRPQYFRIAGRDVQLYAYYVTAGRIALAEEPDEILALPTPKQKPKSQEDK